MRIIVLVGGQGSTTQSCNISAYDKSNMPKYKTEKSIVLSLFFYKSYIFSSS